MKNASARPIRAKTPRIRPAAALAALALALVPTGAVAASGGVGTTPTGTSPVPTTAPVAPTGPMFGERVLRPGMTGADVRILNGIVASKSYARAVPLTDVFESPTASAVRAFQTRTGLRANGVVNPTTATALTGSMRLAETSWYGPGLYGNGVACGGTLRPSTIGVAHKTLPCGTKITFAYHGHYIQAKVIDRGPYIKGRTFDLTKATSDALGVTSAGVADVRYAVAR